MAAAYLPDINVWLALTWAGHVHSSAAWGWLSSVNSRRRDRILLCRIAQLGLLRLLTTKSVMGDSTITIGEAWDAYDKWLMHPGVETLGEPASLNSRFRASTKIWADSAAPKIIGDCYLLALSQAAGATLVTFDGALADRAKHAGHPYALLT